MSDAAKRLRAAAIRDLIHAGWRPPPPTNEQAERIIDDIARLGGDRRRRLGLTDADCRLLALFSDGLTVDQIARRSGRSSETVKTQSTRIREKLGARNTVHAVALAIRAGEV